MCVAMPRRVLRVEGDRLEVEWDDGPLSVSAAGFADLAVGEYVLVHAGQVLDRISGEEAAQILALYADLEGADVSLLVGDADAEVRA